ncbi:uncharacterized protein LOC124158492 isoform X2 [Ischnura elegans]|uniref:uncharacterized protein LOC124158492 isoform X2 n=1 Tax=Ischnura elegans TaxID=197161 RepID=UPI001ED89108|nr:uncharacterized protein LOC124158492 isoform X2 [Ischnura elegans]
MLRWAKMLSHSHFRISILSLVLLRIYLFALFPGASGLRDVRIEVPEAVRRGDRAKLSCHYDLEGSPLYSIKWYRGDEEFYRYVPKESPPSKVFPQLGVNVDVSQSNNRTVVLSDVQLELTGIYKCEVSADAPYFHTDIKAASMVVVDLPDDTPIVRTEKTRYSSGERIRANCTSPSSFPAANLTWFLNGKQVPASSTRQYPVLVVPHRTTAAPTTEGSIWRREDSADDPSAALYSSLAGHMDAFSPLAAAAPTVPALETAVLGLELELDPEAYAFQSPGSAEPSAAASSSSATASSSSSPPFGAMGRFSTPAPSHQQHAQQNPQPKYITLRCLATLFALYRRATEVQLTADEPPPQLAPVLLGAGGDPGVDARYHSADPPPGAPHAYIRL